MTAGAPVDDERPRPASGPFPQPSALPSFLVGLPMSRPVTASGALLRDTAGRVLLVDPTYKEGWDLPGGVIEPGETPSEALVREVAEELGVALTPGPLLVADWCPDRLVGDKLLWIFDGGVLPQEVEDLLRVDGEELAAWAWVERCEVSHLCPPALARRVGLALDALVQGAAIYAEYGRRRA